VKGRIVAPAPKEKTMHSIPVALARRRDLRRTAIVIGILACGGLAACATDEPFGAVRGSSTPPRHGAWTDMPNEPNWSSVPYTAH
jgi:hypothetical protein